MDFSFIESKTVFLIAHLFGLALGAGGAFISDLIFFKSIKDKRISKTEMAFLILTSHAVTIGLIILIISGACLFSLDVERYLESSKFLAKMTVVAIIAANGVFLHFVHIPKLRRLAKKGGVLPREFSSRLFIILSGTVSLVSWSTAVVLGAFRAIPYGYFDIIGLYLGVLGAALIGAFFLRDLLMPPFSHK